MRLKLLIIWITIFCTSSLGVLAQEEGVWNISLDSLVVKAHRNTSAVTTTRDGKISWEIKQLESLPMILGNADPMRYTQMLPGVQTNDELSSGLRIQGGANQHNIILAGGVPLYNVNHLLGFFSSFIPSHYQSMCLTKCPQATQMANRLGGELSMVLPDSIPARVGGELSLGLISSHATLRLPIGRKTSLAFSARGSYMNFLYGRWLRNGEHQFGYSFVDANFTMRHRVSSCDAIIVDGYLGKDNADFFDPSYRASMTATWGNRMAALHWVHNPTHGLKTTSSLYFTQYHNLFGLSMPDMWLRLPSMITDFGYHGHVESGKWRCGIEAIVHMIKPQSIEGERGYQLSARQVTENRPVEASLYGDYCLPIAEHIGLITGLRSSVFANSGVNYYGIDPLLSLYYDNLNTRLTVTIGRKHQYLFQTGFSDAGLPTEFWMPVNRTVKPQTADSFGFAFDHYLFNRGYRLNVDLFYKKLGGQLEYSGSVLDLVNTVYDIDRMLLHGNGENYGCNVMINKCSGRLTGWVGYSFTHAYCRLQGPEQGSAGVFPANHSRPHEFNAVLGYALNSHWNFGMTLVWASGTPYTAARSMSLINGNVIIQYDKHNGSRLRPYARVDVSVNFKWKGRLFKENGLNFSVYNLTNRENEWFYYLKTRKDGQLAYRTITSFLTILPSLNYYCKF